MTLYRAKIKSKKQIKDEIPRVQQGWWADVSAGQTLILRDANESDIARCLISEGNSRNPADYLCETFEGGCLVKRIAIEKLSVIRNCHGCEHLEWHDDDGVDGHPGNDGFGCNKRDEGGMNDALLKRLQDRSYLNYSKRCFEPKVTANGTQADHV